MEKLKSTKVARRILPTKNQNTSVPIKEVLKGIGKTTSKEWAEHWINIVVLSEMWKAIIKGVKKW